MAGFDELLDKSTIWDSNNIPGCVLSAVDENGTYNLTILFIRGTIPMFNCCHPR